MLSLKITDKNILYQSFMPFLRNGGLFIPTDEVCKIGQEVLLSLTLTFMKEIGHINQIAGHIVWITPKEAQNNQTAGVGFHFSNIDERTIEVKNKIETYLASNIKSNDVTHTM